MKPPQAKRVPHVRQVHGDEVDDPWYWLIDRDNPDTIAYLEAENAYAESATAATADLQERVFEEIKSRVQETDLSVPARRGEWWYYSRTVEGLQYAIYCRARDADGTDEQVLLDENILAGESPYFSLGTLDISDDQRLMAYSTDHEGEELYIQHFVDLGTGELLPDTIEGVYYGSAWAADNSTYFYTTLDAARRPYRLWRHRLGADVADDELVYQEDDDRFWLTVYLTRDRTHIVAALNSKVTSEVYVLPSDDPSGALRLIEPRRDEIEYGVEHHGDRFLIVTNDGAINFRLVEAPDDAPGRENWRDVIPGRDDTRIEGVLPFTNHLVVPLRRDGLTGARVIRVDDGETHDVSFPEPVYSVGPSSNLEFDTATYRLSYQSLVTPPSVFDYELESRERTLLKQQPVLGGYDPTQYESAREWATAPDGARVPISLVHRRGVLRDSSAPCVLYGYGSYESSDDPWFSTARLSLLDRGVVFAVAHIRGGGEMGRLWYEDGKLLTKRNTFTDFIACAEHLCATAYTSPARLAARGASAGGLLVGAVANMAPQLFRAIVAEVPFVDAVNTMIDPSLPLTIIERDEWGDPLNDAAVYEYMKSYAPYENIAAIDYPALLVTAGLNDPRVLYHEPAKWVAKLRATSTGTATLVLKTELGAGHQGLSGRYDAWKQEAYVLAFLLHELGAD